MKVFVIADPSDAALAETYAGALEADGHRVSGRGTDQSSASSAAMRKSIASADFVVFLATPRSTTQGSVALSDLSYAHQQKRDAKGRILVLKTEGSVDAEAPMFRAFRSAGPLGSVGELAAIVASERALISKSGKFWPVAAAVLVIAGSVGGLAYYFVGQHGLEADSGGAVAELPSKPGSDVEFEVGVDYSDLVSFGETRHFKLKQTAGSPFKFKCVAGPSPSPNIVAVSNDDTCANIAVTASDGPFVDEQGNPYGIGSYSPDRDVVPVSVQTADGEEVYRTRFPLQAMNGGSFLLRGLKKSPEEFPGDLRVLSVVEPGKTYEVELVTTSGSTLPSAYTCGPNPQFSESSAGRYSLVPIGGCKFRLSNVQFLGSDIATSIHILARRNDPAYEFAPSLDVVGPNYDSPSKGLSGTGVSDEQMIDGLRQFKTRMADWLERHQVSTAPDVWYLDYLKQQIAETEAAIVRLGGTSASPVAGQN